MDNLWFESMFVTIFYNCINVNIVISIAVVYYWIKTIPKNYKNDDKKIKIVYPFLAVFFINIYLIFQALAIEGILEGITGIWLIDQGTEIYRSYLENFVSMNSLNILLYIVFIILIYKTRSVIKSFIVGYCILLLPYFEHVLITSDNKNLMFERINVIIISVLGIIVVRYVYHERHNIKKALINMNNITVLYAFIPIFGVPLFFLKLFVEEKLSILKLSILTSIYYFGYPILVLPIFYLQLSEQYAQALLPYALIKFGFTLIIVVLSLLDFDKKNKTKLESERSENE